MDDVKRLDKRIKELGKHLTKFQRNVVLNVVNGMSQRQAYLVAGGKAKNENSQDVCVSVLLSHAKVDNYYQALMEKAQLGSILTKAEALNILSEQARSESSDPAVVRNSQGAIKQVSSMLAWDAPKRSEITGKDGGAIEVKRVQDLTDDELLAIANDEK